MYNPKYLKKSKINTRIKILAAAVYVLSICMTVVLCRAFMTTPAEQQSPINDNFDLGVIDYTIPLYDGMPRTCSENIFSPDVIPSAHTVVAGDTLWEISETYYGDGNDYVYIESFNDISDTLQVGQVVKIPTEEEKKNIVIEPKAKKNNIVKNNSSSSVDTSNMIYYAKCNITGYNPWCKHCCGKSDGITASGKKAVVGKTVAMTGLPLGAEIYIEGYGYYTVQDTGNFGSQHVDIACNSDEECYTITGNANVYII